MQPLNTKILIAEVAQERKTAGGIVLTSDSSLRETKFGKVLAVGGDVKNVKVDDTIVLDWSKCYPVKVEGTERAIIDEEHVLAVN